MTADRPTTEPRRAIDFERCPVCDNMAVVRLPDDWQAQDRSMPIIACGNPWHYATRSLGDVAEAAQGAAPRAEGPDEDLGKQLAHLANLIASHEILKALGLAESLASKYGGYTYGPPIDLSDERLELPDPSEPGAGW